ncbi:MAG: hypothetical protein KY461_00745 [Actinobacteria bacterium]|nr:hypothetical protein [Actinomycetota bacterium]
MGKFVVQERDRSTSGTAEYLVLNVEDRSRPVASFRERADAQAHADKLNAGPLDWDEQEQWQEDDDWGPDDDAGSA